MYLYIIECDEGNGFATIEGFFGSDRTKVAVEANQRCDELRDKEPDYEYNVVCVSKLTEV